MIETAHQPPAQTIDLEGFLVGSDLHQVCLVMPPYTLELAPDDVVHV
ncbi:MAG: hypothetical protein HKN47_04820, partial [Pirellulaceae bacterium]|nr:hypothetical protein [Pirellulaceae bacterium]